MKTTIQGILTIAAAVIGGGLAYSKGQAIDLATIIAAISAGIGLIQAKDASKPTK